MASTVDPSRKENGMTNGDALLTLQKMFPHKSGIRVRAAGEKVHRLARAATLFIYLESRGEFEIHETVFGQREAKSDTWWSRYFHSKVFAGTGANKDSPIHRMGVLDGAIVPGVNRKTSRIWSVRAVIGYALHDNVNAVYPALHSHRHQTKR
jgi:hypothetical protein